MCLKHHWELVDPCTFLSFKLLLEIVLYGFNRRFDLPVYLRIPGFVDSKFLAHLLQSKIVELFFVVSDDRVWDSKLADDVSPYEVHALLLYDHG